MKTVLEIRGSLQEISNFLGNTAIISRNLCPVLGQNLFQIYDTGPFFLSLFFFLVPDNGRLIVVFYTVITMEVTCSDSK